MSALHFTHPWLLWALLFAWLPMLALGVRQFAFPSLHGWRLPWTARILPWLLKGLAVTTLICLVMTMAGPYLEGGVEQRVGKGAEIVIVLDRSGSMSEGLKGRDVSRLDAETGKDDSQFLSKIEAARKVLLKFMQQRPGDTFGVVAFNSSPINVAPLSADRALAEAALMSAQSQSTGFTALSRALGMALEYFDGRPKTATRVILLVSDGDAIIEPEDQAILKQAFQYYGAQLMWIYVQGERETSILDTVIAGDNEIITEADRTFAASAQSASMHQVFSQLGMPYQAFEVQSEVGMRQAVQAIAKATNRPTRYAYRLPRQDLAGWGYGLCVVLITLLGWLRQQMLTAWVPAPLPPAFATAAQLPTVPWDATPSTEESHALSAKT
jgi:mxaC protein